MKYAPVRVTEETRDTLKFIQRELAVKYNRDFSLGDIVLWLIHGYSGNPKLAEHLTEIISRRPNNLFPEESPDE